MEPISMRVAIVTESFLPNINGVTNSVLRILEFFDSYGHDAIVIAPGSKRADTNYLEFKVKHAPSFPLGQLLPIGIPRRALRHYIEGFGPDVIHLASPAILGSYVNHVSVELSIPTVSVYQTDIAGFAKNYGISLGQTSIQRAIAKIHDRTMRTLAPSSSAAAALRKFGTKNVHIWPRGVDTNRFSPFKRSEELRRKWGSPRKRIVGYVGRLAKEKSLHILEEISQIDSFQLVLVGDGPDRKRLETLMPNAIFTGLLVGEDLPAAMASFDLFAHTGASETFCQSIQEALASGVPAVAPASGGPLDLIIDGENGHFFGYESGRTLLESIEETLSGDVTEFELRARESVLGRDWDSINKLLIRHYQEVLFEPVGRVAA